MIGFVSDGDGALCALAVAAKLLDMQTKGDYLEGDVFVSTQICPHAPTAPHKPVPFMGSPVEMSQVNKEEVSPELDAILTVDTTKGNRVINTRGFAISNTVKEGWILRVSEDLLEIMQRTTGQLPYVFPLSMQDITPYGNDVYHLNSILQPCTATKAPVVGVAITTETMVPGCATGSSHFADVEEAARYMMEVAKSFGRGEASFYDEKEYERLFIREPEVKARAGKMAYVRPEYHERIMRITRVIGHDRLTLSAYIDHVLTHHFNQCEDAIKSLYARNYNSVF